MKQNNKDDADSNYHLLSIYRGPDLVLKALHVLHHLILTTRQNGWENIIRQCGRGIFEPRGICRARWPGVRPPFYENQSESLQQSLRMISGPSQCPLLLSFIDMINVPLGILGAELSLKKLCLTYLQVPHSIYSRMPAIMVCFSCSTGQLLLGNSHLLTILKAETTLPCRTSLKAR